MFRRLFSAGRRRVFSQWGLLRFVLTLFIPILFLGSAVDVSGQTVSRWKVMLDGLAERGYYDTSLDYLKWMEQMPFCPPDLKEQLDYQIGMIHIEAMETGRLFLNQAEHLKACRESLAKFLKEHPENEYVFETNTTLGNLLLQEGRAAMTRSTQETTPAAERPRLVEEARGKFEEALAFFKAADKLAVAAARKVMAAGGNPETQPQPFGRVIAGKIYVNLINLEIAKTFPKDGEEFKNRMRSTAESFQKLGARYSEYAAGFEAKLFAARAYRDLGDTKKAREILAELNVLTGEDFMNVLTGSLLLTLEMNLEEKNYADSIRRVAAWAENVPTLYRNSADGQMIYLQGARTLIAHAGAVRETDKADADRSLRTAGVYLRGIRSGAGDTFREAQKLLAEIGAAGSQQRAGEILNYADAKEQAEEDLRNLVVAFNAYREAPSDARDDAEKELLRVGTVCEQALQRAVLMREDDTPIQEVNRLRSQLANVYNVVGKRLESAVVAEFLARRYSSEPDADKMASMAVKMYRSVFAEETNEKKKNPAADPTAYAEALDSLAEFILVRWPGKEVVDEVLLIRIITAIEDGRLDEARKMIEEAGDKPYRCEAQLRFGQALWSQYVAALRLPEEERPAKRKLQEMLDDAKSQLETGMEMRLKQLEDGETLDWLTVHAALSLAQIAQSNNDATESLRWLNHSRVGPVTLIRNTPPGLSLSELRINPNTKLSVIMMELRAYVGAEDLDKAEETMNNLETLIKEEHGDNDQKLTAVYVSLGRQLEDRLKELNEAGDADQRDKLTKGFEMFLERIRQRDSNTFQSLYWVADTYYRLGSGLTPEGGRIPPEAVSYFEDAAGTYVRILKALRDDPDWEAPAGAENTITLRLAESLRCSDKAANAARFLGTLLQNAENRIDIQIEMAKALQAWGRSDPKMYIKAIAGGKPPENVDTGKAAIWGWNGIIKRTSGNIDRFRDQYFEAYHGKFRCCIEYAEAEKGSANAQKLLEGSERDITRLVQLRPDVGGEEWFAKIDRDLRDIRKALGQSKPGGLKALIKELSVEPGVP